MVAFLWGTQIVLLALALRSSLGRGCPAFSCWLALALARELLLLVCSPWDYTFLYYASRNLLILLSLAVVQECRDTKQQLLPYPRCIAQGFTLYVVLAVPLVVVPPDPTTQAVKMVPLVAAAVLWLRGLTCDKPPLGDCQWRDSWSLSLS